jgi:hypothetical protein
MALTEDSAYQLLREAIIGRRSLRANYRDYFRMFCPYMLGTDLEGDRAVIVFQYDGGQPGGLPALGLWHTWKVAKMHSIGLAGDRWRCGELGDAPRLAIIDVVAVTDDN